MNLRTALYSLHLDLGARLVPFGEWDMPVQYSGIINEVKAVRAGQGVFDVSHMGRLYLSGGKAGEFLDWVLTSSATTLRVGRARYGFICNQAGGVIDDTIFYRLDEDRYLLIPNAGNREAVVAWFRRWIDEKFAGGVTLEDRTTDTGLIAYQGPETVAVLDRLCRLADGGAPSAQRPFTWRRATLGDRPVFLGRTGYTGEDGFELGLAAADAEAVWRVLLEQGAVPCGLGARDVLRLEAGLPLHGHELDAETTPIEAGLARFVRAEGHFVGAAALQQQRSSGVERQLVGLTLPGRSAPRAGYPVSYQGRPVGRVTSGTYSPTLDTSIAMGYVLVQYASPGQDLEVDLRGRLAPVEVTPLPFYTRSRRSQQDES